jgi:long-chain acyl-CoA synthetase
VLLAEHFRAEDVLATIQKERVTTTFMVPTHLERVLASERGGRRFDLSSMRLLAHAGAPIREETKLATIRLFPGPSVWEFYGSTEGPATRISAQEWLQKRGSVGTAGEGGRIRILDDAHNELPPGEVGQIWVEDPHAERFAYWNDPSKTGAAWHGDSYSVGDLGWVDADGYLFLTGRKDDTIITGGVNVYPQEVELVLLEHPEIAEAVVFGEPSEEWGEAVRARVVLESGASTEGEAIRDWLRARTAHYKCPQVIDIVPSLERTATGKLKRPGASTA